MRPPIVLLAANLAGCWHDAEPAKPVPAPIADARGTVARSTPPDDTALCQRWIERSQPLVEREAPGLVDWDDLDRSCDVVKPEERPFLQCVADAADDAAVGACWKTYFKLDINPANALDGH